MTLAEVLHLLVEDGIEAARHRSGGGERSRGEMDAYAACRDKEPPQLKDMLTEAAVGRVRAQQSGADDAEYLVGYESAVETVGSVMSCALEYHGLPPITRITIAARMRYAGIVGYDGHDATISRNRR